jgi:CrcB protein
MTLYLLVALGGAIGSVARFVVGRAVDRAWVGAFPAGTLLVNVLGSLLMGALAVWIVARFENDPAVRAFVLTGMLGGFTTFSAFSIDAIGLIERGETVAAVAYIVASVTLSLAACLAGAALARMVTA